MIFFMKYKYNYLGLVSDLDSQASLLEDSLNPEQAFSYLESSLPEEVDSLEASLYENTVKHDLYENTLESNVYENWSHNHNNDHQGIQMYLYYIWSKVNVQ